MHLSRDEILEAVCERNSHKVYLGYEKWLFPRVAWQHGCGPSASAEEIKRRSIDWAETVSATSGAVYPEIRLHADGSSCDVTQGEINRLYFTWKESLVETSPG